MAKTEARKRAETGVAVGVVVLVGAFIFAGQGPMHWLRLATNGEYRRCWGLAAGELRDGYGVTEALVGEDQIRWVATKWDGDVYASQTMICERGADRIEGSALD